MKAQIDVIKVSPEPLVRHTLVKLLTVGSAIPHRTAAALVLDQFGKARIWDGHLKDDDCCLLTVRIIQNLRFHPLPFWVHHSFGWAS